jgi:peptidoglycan hydrolase-like protein with peptidoglycan-binding domain
MFGLAAAGGVATAAACAAPVVYGPPVYAAPAPVYTVPAPVYAAPAYSSVGYYQPPQTVVVEEKRVSRPQADPPNNTLAKAEAKLAGLGYYKGSVDGEYGPVIQQAIQQFQADNGLPVSGRLDLKTLSSLGIAL